VTAYSTRGNAYKALKQYRNAVSDYTEVIRRLPDADAYRNRGEAYEALGDTKRADADFKKAQQLLEPSKD
jgi:tetratricopeptide (TPR) repeat protein